MASGEFTIRCKTQNGSFKLRSVNSESTVHELKMHISNKTNLAPQFIKILCGYPPRALPPGKDNAKLKDVNIHSGETIIIELKMKDEIDERQPATNSIGIKVKENEDQPDPDSSVTVPEASAVSVSEGESASEVKPSFVRIDPSWADAAPFLDEMDGGIMLRHAVPSNNSCLFTSVYFCLSNGDLNERKSDELRSLIAHIVSHNRGHYNEVFLGMDNDSYCNWIQDSTTWGGAIELSILSEHFCIEIVAVDAINLTMHRFGEGSNFANRIFLLYDGIHYDPLIVEMDTAVQSIFPVNDSRPTEMALEIAREAKSSNQFTDVSNFSLKCMVCDMKLRGHAEAQRHAKATGHNFLEEFVPS